MKAKKLFSVVLALAMILSLFPVLTTPAKAVSLGNWKDYTSAPTAYNSGTNTYTITSATELAWFANAINTGSIAGNTKAVITAASIDLSAHSWTPIGDIGTNPYYGTFDGGSCVISGLNMTAVSQYLPACLVMYIPTRSAM